MSSGEIAIVVIAAALAALVKSTTGMGFPIVLIPVLALFIDVADAIVIVAPANVALNVSVSWNARHDRGEVVGFSSFVSASIVGAVIGGLLLPLLPGQALRILLVTVIGIFLLNRLRNPAAKLSPSVTRVLSPVAGGVAGLFQGATGVSGPIVTPWFMSQTLGRQAFVFAISAAFTVSGLAQLVVLIFAGLFVDDVLTAAVALVPVAVILIPFGMRLRERVSSAAFENAIVVLLIVSAVSILVRMF